MLKWKLLVLISVFIFLDRKLVTANICEFLQQKEFNPCVPAVDEIRGTSPRALLLPPSCDHNTQQRRHQLMQQV